MASVLIVVVSGIQSVYEHQLGLLSVESRLYTNTNLSSF